MGGNDIFNDQLFFPAGGKDLFFVPARINNGSLLGFFARDDITADTHHADSELLDYHI